MRYQAVLWDLDGTLLNTLTDLSNSVNWALQQSGQPQVPPQEVCAGTGNGVRELLTACTPGGTSNPHFSKICDDFVAHYDKHGDDFTAPYPGMMALLHTLQAAQVPMGIVSNKLDWAVKQLGAQHFPGLMQVCVGEREGVRRKPCPDVIYAAVKELQSDLQHTVYIGDSEVDIQTARNAGMDCIAVTWGFRTRQALLEAGATVLADTPEQLLDLLQGSETSL